MDYDLHAPDLKELKEFYNLLGKGKLKVDYKNYFKEFDFSPRNRSGIPIAHLEASGRIAEQTAHIYETRYDEVKAFYLKSGEQPFQLTREGEGQTVSLNLCAVAASAHVAKFFTETHIEPFAVIALHRLLADQNHHWIFAHLCESCYAIAQLSNLRANISPEVLLLLGEMQDMLGIAIVQFLHGAN